MFLNRTFFALVFAAVGFVYTAIAGQQGLTIDPDGSRHAHAAARISHASPLFDQGLTIDPDGRQ
jgi:hypothetical protein